MRRNTKSSATEILLMLIGLVMLVAGKNMAVILEPQVRISSAGLNNAQQERLDQSATASLFGQFRTSTADFLWLKADRYLHSGVDMRGMTKWEKAHIQKMNRVIHTGGKDAEGNREHHDETTAVPSAASDWRGWLGDMDRQVKPFKDMTNHKHKDPKEALPLFRLMTISNPQFVPGYTVGAAMIARDRTQYQEAVAYLKEGEKNNPRSIEIQSSLGEMMTGKLRQYDAALPYLKQAIKLAQERDISTLSEDEKEAWQFAYRWAVLSRREAKDLKSAREFALAGLKEFPDDVICRHYLKVGTP